MRVGITFDYNSKGVKDAKQGILALGKSAIAGAVGIGTAGAALTKLNALLRDSVQLAMADQKAQANLTKTLQNAGFGMAAAQVNEYVSSLQMASGVSEDQLRPAFLQLFNSLGSVTKAQQVLNIAMDTAAATGRDLSSVTAAIAKAAAGSNTSIQRLGLGISKAELASSSFDQILGILETKFKGSTAVAADTMSGKMDRLRIAVEEAKEEIGVGLLDAFDLLAKEGGADIDSLTAKIVNLGTTTGDVFRGIAGAWNGVSNAFSKTMLGKMLIQFAGGSGETGVFGWLLDSIPILGTQLRSLRQLGNIGAYQRRQDAIGTGGSYFTLQAQRRQEQLAANNRRKEASAKAATAAKDAARKRAEEAQKKRQAALDKQSAELAMKYDTERANIAAAFAKTQSSDTKQRLVDLMAINTQQYAQNLGLTSMEQIYDLINKQLGLAVRQINDAAAAQRNWNSATAAMPFIGPTVPGAAPYVGLAKPGAVGVYGPTVPTGDAITNTTPFIGQQIPGTINERAGIAAGPSVTVNINGPTIGSDVDQVVLDAVNRATRRGGLLRGSQAVL